MSVSAGGGSIKSKWIKSLMPSDLSISTTEPSRKHLPGATRPARPARWFADDFATGVTMSDSIDVRGLYEFILLKPGSMT
eukprot:scaffold4687_cov117-Isochrysis_galbana.AAC.10